MERRSSFHPLPPPERIVPHVANKPFDIRLMPLLVLALGALFLPGRLSAQPDIPPILSFSPASTRESLVAAAKSHIGTPYRSGGTDRSGLDCSGLVVIAFKEATGRDLPRTVDEQARWVVAIPRKEMEPGDLVFFNLEEPSDSGLYTLAGFRPVAAGFPLSERIKANHVGIYAGDGQFIHSASRGSKTGVMVNSLYETSWAKRFLFAGRAISASALSGFAIDWQLGASFGAADNLIPTFRGLSAGASASFPLSSNFRLGLEACLTWDKMLNVARIPLELVVGQSSGLSVFAGPAITVGSLSLAGGEGEPERGYSAVNEWIASAGLRWSPLFLGSSPVRGGIYVELRYDRYAPHTGQAQDNVADIRSAITLGLGFRVRSVHY